MKNLPALKFLLVIFLITTMGCEDLVVENQTFKIGQESTFRIHQRYTSTDGPYTLQINEINDSRCPEGVQCVWQGEVTIKGIWTSNSDTSSFEVHSVLKDLNKQPVGFTIQITDALPYPKYGRDDRPEDLIITLLIEENNDKLDTLSFIHSTKGYELYSWPNGDDWNYSILLGTNRVKFYDEIMANKITVVGKDSLKMLLDKFPKNEYVSWLAKLRGDEGGDISLPDQNTIDEIKDYASQKELNFNVVE